MIKCKHCGQDVNGEGKFCTKCGGGLVSETVATVQVPKQGNGTKEQKGISWWKYIKIAVVVLIVAVVGLGMLGNKSESKAEYSLKASQLAEEYNKDIVAADAKYKNKTITVNGGVIRKGQFVNSNNIFIVLYEKDKQNVLIGITIDEKSKVNQLKDGDFVEVKGVCQGTVAQEDKSAMSIQIYNATISK